MITDELQSKTIDFLRFPLIIGVVLIHTQLSEVVINGENVVDKDSFPLYSMVDYIVSGVFSRTAVPLFFFISGFLFFYKSEFSVSMYAMKLKKRLRTLLVPYLFWNLMVILLFFLAQTFLPSLMSGDNKLISEYSFSDWCAAFWNSNSSMPICFQLWFIRDLMVVVLLSPLIYGVVRFLRGYGVIILGVLWALNLSFGAGFSTTSFFFFSLGAWFSVHGRNFIDDSKLLLPKCAVVYGILVLLDFVSMRQWWYIFLHNVTVFVGMVTIVNLSVYMLERKKWGINALLSRSSFFIYAYHGMVLALLLKVCCKLLLPQSEIMLLFLYFFCPFFVIVFGVGIYFLGERYMPWFTRMITGGR